MKKVLLVLSAALMIASCASIPVPKDENEAMAVLVTEFRQEARIESFGHYMFEISNADGSYKKYVRVDKDRNYYLTGLTPGQYTVSYIFVYDNGDRWGTRTDLFSFVVHEGKTHIISKKIVVRIYQEGKNKAWMTRFAERIPTKDLDQMKEELIKEHPELASWDWE